MFYVTGSIGIIMGLSPLTFATFKLMITFMGVLNIALGAFFTYLFLTQVAKEPDKRKKKKKHDSRP